MGEPSEVIAYVLVAMVAVIILRSFLPSGRRRRDGTPDRRSNRPANRTGKPSRPQPDVRRQRQGPRQPQPLPAIAVNPQSILVDGSNVMHWQDNTPDSATLMRVLAALRKHGNDPILCFDANVGYKLFGAHLDPADLGRLFGVSPAHVLVTASGTDADAMILQAAVTHGIPVVSNDRYLDYPDLVGQVDRMNGTIDDGVVTLRLRKPPRAAATEHRHRAQ